MKILFKSIFTIDLEKEVTEKRGIPENFNTFIVGLLKHIQDNKSIRHFKPIRQTTEVVNCTRQILSVSISDKTGKDEAISELCNNIAHKLLQVELNKEAQIERLGKHVKQGSLVQAVLSNDNGDELFFLVSKVEHSNFFEEDNFLLKRGFPDKQNIWKSCIFETSIEGEEVTVQLARVYTDTDAKYWHAAFLDLVPIMDDELNTNIAFNKIDVTLKRKLKKDYYSDFLELRNEIIGTFRRGQHIDYYEMVNDIFSKYKPINVDPNKLELLKKELLGLPEKYNFDGQFNAVSDIITAKIIKQSYRVNQGIELQLNDYVEDLKATIKAQETESGKFIVIQTNNNELFEIFKR